MPRRGPRRAAPAWLLLLVAVAAPSCSPDERTPTSAFSGPAGMALAGSAFDHVFVANSGTDSVQVVRLGEGLRRADLEPAPARYFPLNIPAGPNVTQLAASADGRFVFVLDEISSTARLIDADARMLVRGADGAPLELPLGPREAQAAAIAGSPWPCAPTETTQQTCLGRAFVGLRRLGSIAAIDVRRAPDGALSLALDAQFAVGSQPVALAAHPSQPVLFVTDASSPTLVRVQVQASLDGNGQQVGDPLGTVTRTPVGAPATAVAVAGDGRTLAVARPTLQDVALFRSEAGDVAQGALVPLDADPVRTPMPRCLLACNQIDAGACAGAHPADAALCSLPAGYASQPGHAYGALWLGSVPAALLPLSRSMAGAPLVERCAAGGAKNATEFEHGFAVASHSGEVQLIGLLPDAEGGAQRARLLDAASCRTPSIRPVSPKQVRLQEVLAPCAPMAEKRSRITCLAEGDGASPGVVGLMRGLAERVAVGLSWEGVLSGGDRSGGGGAIDEAGRLYDAGHQANSDLGAVPIEVRKEARGRVLHRGDIVEILTPQLAIPECGGQDGRPAQACTLERRIVGTERQDDRTHLVLDVPLRAACFAPGQQLAFRIRAGDAFMAGATDASGRLTGETVRLRPGETYGAGLRAEAAAPLFFTIDPALETGAELAACERYRAGGRGPGPGQPAWRARDQLLSFVAQDEFEPVRVGEQVGLPAGASQGAASAAAAGRMPYGMVVTRAGSTGPTPLLLISYRGSDAVLVAAGLDSGDAGRDNIARMLR